MKPLDVKAMLLLLGDNVRYYRNQLELSQDELAYRCNVSKNYLSDVERGTRNLTLKVMVQIAIGLKVQLVDLLVDHHLD